jgi:hypothetical protein
LQSRQPFGGKSPPPERNRIFGTAELRGDLKIRWSIVIRRPKHEADTKREGLRSRTGTKQTFQLITNGTIQND